MIQSSSSRMRVINHNWSATKQRPHQQSVAEISRHSVLSGDRIRQCETSSMIQWKQTLKVQWVQSSQRGKERQWDASVDEDIAERPRHDCLPVQTCFLQHINHSLQLLHTQPARTHLHTLSYLVPFWTGMLPCEAVQGGWMAVLKHHLQQLLTAIAGRLTMCSMSVCLVCIKCELFRLNNNNNNIHISIPHKIITSAVMLLPPVSILTRTNTQLTAL